MPGKKDKTTEEGAASPAKAATKTASPKKGAGSKSKKTNADKALTVPKRMKPTESKRKVKAIQRFTEVTEPKEEKPIVIKKGKGKKFEDCPQVLHQINKRRRNDDTLKLVHQFLLGRVTKKVTLKENLKDFNGLVYDDDKDKERFLQKLEKLHLRTLRDLAKFFGVDNDGERDVVAKAIVAFLEKPHALDVPVERKRKRSASPASRRSASPASRGTKRRKKDPNAPKRPLSSYMLFCQAHREEVKKKYPGEGVVEIVKHLSKMWAKASDTEKKKFEAKAAKEKETYMKAVKKYEKKKE